MNISVYTDESLSGDNESHALCGVWGTSDACSLLRTAVQKHLCCFDTETIKWSKIRAKKTYIRCALGVLLITMQRCDAGDDRGICCFVGSDLSELYLQMIDQFSITGYSAIELFPDKNLELQRHRSDHMFSDYSGVRHVTPVQLTTEPLLIIADIFAGMMREQAQSPGIFTHTGIYETHLPLRYKILLRTVWKIYQSSKKTV